MKQKDSGVVEQFTSAAKTLLVYELSWRWRNRGQKRSRSSLQLKIVSKCLKMNNMHGLEKEIQLKEEYVELCQQELEAHMKRMSRRRTPRRDQEEDIGENEVGRGGGGAA